ncbi:2'-5' RNA ligase family protein [Zoogloea sp.]|uniref:2'-5' RNA ligase family protein n=1 Tax=Zoogloea sp. TaxID=49181 RepID=UPI0031FD48DB
MHPVPPKPLPPPGDDALDQARRDFLAAGHTLENIRRDFPEWHRGRPRYLLWAIDADRPAIRENVARAAHHLQDILLADYVRQPHITLALCGFPTDEPQQDDDFGPSALLAQLKALRRAACAPFMLQIGQLASFSSAPFLAAQDLEGGLGVLHDALSPTTHPSGGPYVPHVTVGLYKGRYPTPQVQARLDAHAARPVLCPVDRISLMSYAASEIGGPLAHLADYDLASQVLVWHDDPLHLKLQAASSSSTGIRSHPDGSAIH